MTTIRLSASPLPCEPAQSEALGAYSPDYLRAYNLVLDAECHANEQVRDNPSNQQAKDDLISARAAGYLLLELFNRRRGVLSEGPCASFVKQLNSPSRQGKSGIQLVFELGKYHRDRLLRSCGFDFFPALLGVSVFSQFKQQPQSTHHPPHTLRAPPLTRWRR